ncbi:hypothetical protein HPULCUR_005379 [Helicostylum pulchrum]|uniref:Cytidyltransferase-like domain-containing protein n=1 Tax=Helicostylum pulchrum TaxID=562976 RepID=A0ABP9Y095_9FUNG
MCSPKVMASTLKARGFGDDNILGEFHDNYSFPRQLIPETMNDDSKIPLVIVACGSYSPITYLHLRMFEMARDHFDEREGYELIAGYFSPVSDAYMKEGLAKASHRVKMCQLAVDSTSDWLMVDSWESRQSMYQRTAVVLDHFDYELNQVGGGIKTQSGEVRKIKIMLLAGGDLMASFGHPGVWTSEDMNVLIIKQLIHNDISSTKIRLFVKRGMSIKYLLPNPVIDYISDHRLYLPEL